MYFQNIKGNDRIKTFLTHMVEKGAIGNSLLFCGPEGIGKGLFALELGKMVICQDDPTGSHRHKIEAGTHPDVHIYKPSGKLGLHSIEAMRQFSQEVYMTPNEANWKVFIIHDADRMLPYSSNALLKTFEEPTTDSLIILISSSPENLLPTVISRCRTVYFQPLQDNEIKPKTQEQDSRKKLLIDVMKAGRFTSYNDLQKFAGEVSDATDQIKTEVEEASRKELLQDVKENFSAVQQQAIEKEIEGAVSMRYVEEVNALFDTILGWYRDLHLLHVNGDPSHLIHCDQRNDLEQTLQRGDLKSLEDIQTIIRETKLSIQRSSPLNTCLESLFLKLKFLD